MAYPATYRYTRDHEWVEAQGELGTIGLTDYAQCQLGDIVFVELPKLGDTLEASKPLGTVESVKAANEIYAPVSGEVVELNETLKDAPEKINADPHGGGWLVKVRLKNPREMNDLMDAPAYEAYIAAASKETSH